MTADNAPYGNLPAWMRFLVDALTEVTMMTDPLEDDDELEFLDDAESDAKS